MISLLCKKYKVIVSDKLIILETNSRKKRIFKFFMENKKKSKHMNTFYYSNDYHYNTNLIYSWSLGNKFRIYKIQNFAIIALKYQANDKYTNKYDLLRWLKKTRKSAYIYTPK